MLTTDP